MPRDPAARRRELFEREARKSPEQRRAEVEAAFRGTTAWRICRLVSGTLRPTCEGRVRQVVRPPARRRGAGRPAARRVARSRSPGGGSDPHLGEPGEPSHKRQAVAA